MTRYVALLRGINVGAHHRIKMPILKEIATDLGYGDPQTYLQSGNLAVTTSAKEPALVRALGAAIAERTGFDVPVVVRSHDELVAVVEANPLPADPKLLSVVYCSKPVTDLGVDPDAYGEEKAVARGREIYLWTPGGMHASKLASALSRTASRDGTVRNWRTAQALVDLTA
ncbi:MAG TPA: DUF1697 domain-containing protein [Mycobacteriales bacterium]